LIDLIKHRLESYQSANSLAEQQALKEIIQEVCLYALWRAKFFEMAAFQGGTSLRILHQLPRFSEDLDFILLKKMDSFEWQPYLNIILETFTTFGLTTEVQDKSRLDQRIRKAVIKNDSVVNQFNFSFPYDKRQKIKIKLEVDIHPPAYSLFEYKFLSFPLDFEVCHQDLASNMALKIHALLCRPYTKGRDWFDFSWYIANGTKPNLKHLEAALQQFGPFQNQSIKVDDQWLENALREKIQSIDWQDAVRDVEGFLGKLQRETLALWSGWFFEKKIEHLTQKNVGE